MTITYYDDMLQGSDEWLEVRRGIITASSMCEVITPTKLEPCKCRDGGETDYLFELMHQRINGFVEPTYVSYDMLRGKEDEPIAKALYNDNIKPVKDCGFVKNDEWGFTLGCSPDWLEDDESGGECKSRKGSLQMKSIMEDFIKPDAMLQIQTCMLVTQRNSWNSVSFCGGARMKVIKVKPDNKIRDAIITGCRSFEKRLSDMIDRYNEMIATDKTLLPTERRKEQLLQEGETV